MARGERLHQIARALCSPGLCARVLEPAIADLQHDPSVGAYAAFWRSLAWCCVRDASALESRAFRLDAAQAFLIAVAVIAASEFVFLHTGYGLRRVALRLLYWGPFMPYVGWSAVIDTGTLTFGVPLALLPALWYAARRSSRFPPAVALVTIAVGVLVTLVSSGWLAPAVVSVGGPNVGWERFDSCPDCEAWPELVRGAFAPPIHRYPSVPNYVAPEDRGTAAWHRSVTEERLLLLVLALASGLCGWWIGARSRALHGAPA